MEEIKQPIKVNYPKIGSTLLDEENKKYQEELDKITSDTYINAGTIRTIKNIKETLVNVIRRKYHKTNGELTKIVDSLLKIHGLHEDNFDFMASFSRLTSNKLNDVSIDENANKNTVSVKGYMKETTLAVDKLIGYDYLYRTMKELYGQAEAKKLSAKMYDLSLALADSSNILLPYCWAIDASKLVTVGRDFGTLKSKPAKRFSSYVAALNELTHQISNHLAGAVAIGTFFLDAAHLLIYKERVSFKELKENKKIRKYIENNYQTFIHSMHNLSRNGGVESPFTNVSIFDKEKLRSLISEENYSWYFPKKIKVLVDNDLGGEEYKLSNEEYVNFVLDYIFELQKMYVDFFDKGDPSENGLQYRFPVTTINLSKHINENGKPYLKQDNELFNYIIRKDISKYNIFTSEGTKVASCCRLISNKEMLDMASSVNAFGGSNISLGSHRVVTVNLQRIALEVDNYNDYKKVLERRIEYMAKILKAHRLLIMKFADKGFHPFIKNGWINMNRMFSTYGIMGIVEANYILNKKINNNVDYKEEILKFINEKCKQYSDKYGFIYNIEQIPGESMAVRLVKADRLLFGNPYDLPELLANQNIPLWEDATIYEKMDADGRLNQLYTGGGIVHIQIDGNVTPTQAKNIINYAVESGCEHFALNAVYSKCTKCGEVIKQKLTKCPVCGYDEMEYYTRVVGFFTPVKDWNTVRREWEFQRRKFVDLKSIKDKKLN